MSIGSVEQEWLISITTMSSLYRPESAAPQQLSFTDACILFTEHVQASSKDSVSMYSGAVYGDEKYRLDVNVIAMSAAIVDCDNTIIVDGEKRPTLTPTLPADHFDNLDGLTFFYHSTYSNTEFWPKWRLIIPFDRHATLQEWPFVVKGIIELLGGHDPNFDYTCFQVSRAFYVPSYPAANKDYAFSGYSDGKEVVRVFP